LKAASTVALLTTFAWLLHPIQVSTVAYTVQRMTELSALFTLIGMLCYVKGRDLINKEKIIAGYLLISSGLGCTYIFGILSKENAILIALYVLVMEFSLFSKDTRSLHLKVWLLIFTVIPLAALIAYLSPKIVSHLFVDYSNRPFTSLERLMTEFRILVEYLQKIWLPRLNDFGLFYSGIKISTSIFNPITTLTSLLFIVFLIGASIKIRTKYPLITFGVLLFFAAHALESTMLYLELYFEHRNYIASLGAIVALVGVVYYFYNSNLFKYKKARFFISGIFILSWLGLLSWITVHESLLWANPVQQAKNWADKNPHSYRAQGHYSHILTMTGNTWAAYKNYERNMAILPKDPAIPLLWIQLKCQDDKIPLPTNKTIQTRLQSAIFQHAVVMTFDEIAESIKDGTCKHLRSSYMLEILNLYITSPIFNKYETAHRSLLIVKSKLNVADNDILGAIASLQEAIQINYTPDIALSLIYLHNANNNPIQAKSYINQLMTYCNEHKLTCLPHKKELSSLTKIN
jgi:hypothetical protein